MPVAVLVAATYGFPSLASFSGSAPDIFLWSIPLGLAVSAGFSVYLILFTPTLKGPEPAPTGDEQHAFSRDLSSPANEVLRCALALAHSKPEEARAALGAGLVEARRCGDTQGIMALARHAALSCEQANELGEALGYYEEALQHEPNDALLHYAVGNVRRTLGQRDSARAAFLDSLELGRQQGDDDVIGIASNALAALDRPTGER